MRDYAELVELIRSFACNQYPQCEDCEMVLNGHECRSAIERKAADAIEELLAGKAKLENSGKLLVAAFDRLKEKVPQWISVEERLPEESGYTIVFCADGERRHVTFAKYQKTPKRWELNGARSYWRVLKWMPLPAPPKEVQDG